MEKVFPVTKNGLREIVPECFECPDRVTCLKKAMTTQEGIEMRSEILDRSPAHGLFGRIRRWSERKELYRLSELKKKKRK